MRLEDLVFTLVEVDGTWCWTLPPVAVDPVEDPYAPWRGSFAFDDEGRYLEAAA